MLAKMSSAKSGTKLMAFPLAKWSCHSSNKIIIKKHDDMWNVSYILPESLSYEDY